MTLTSLGLDVHEEVRVDGGYTIDAVIEWRGVRVGIEVDGPSHFVGGTPTRGVPQVETRTRDRPSSPLWTFEWPSNWPHPCDLFVIISESS